MEAYWNIVSGLSSVCMIVQQIIAPSLCWCGFHFIRAFVRLRLAYLNLISQSLNISLDLVALSFIR